LFDWLSPLDMELLQATLSTAAVFLPTFLKHCSLAFPRPLSPYISPPRMFTTNSLCPITRPVHK
jgi:hypothetical protein